MGFFFRYKIKVGDSVCIIEEVLEWVYFVIKIIMYFKYYDEYKENDIVLVKLFFRVIFIWNVCKVCFL